MTKHQKKKTSDDRARDIEWLDPEPEHGCQISRRKLLCGQPTFVIIWGRNGGVSMCLECWKRLMAIAADGHVDTLELRRKYVAVKSRKVPLILEEGRTEIPPKPSRAVPRSKAKISKQKRRPPPSVGPGPLQRMA